VCRPRLVEDETADLRLRSIFSRYDLAVVSLDVEGPPGVKAAASVLFLVFIKEWQHAAGNDQEADR
jgi:hypothetical protein